MKAYYYTAATGLSAEPFKYFIAHNKRQIKEYLTGTHLDPNQIFDPTDKPIPGIRYIDLTKNKNTNQ